MYLLGILLGKLVGTFQKCPLFTVIALFFAFIIHSFCSFFLRALSLAFIVFTLAIVSMTLMTLMIPTIPFDCYLYLILHSLSLI